VTIKQKVEQRAANSERRQSGEGIAVHELEPSPKKSRSEGARSKRTFEWLAGQIQWFSDSIPHRNVLELNYADWNAVHETCAAYFGDDPKNPKQILGLKHFRRTRESHPLVAKAVESVVRAAIGGAVYDDLAARNELPGWKILCKNPRKNETFGRCKTCCANESLKISAAATGNREAYAQAKAAYDIHYQDFMSRRGRHNDLMMEAKQNPNEVLAITIDGIDKRKMQSPILPKALKRDKDLAQMKRFPLTMVGAIAHGHQRDGANDDDEDRSHRYAIFYDALLGNQPGISGAGANETLSTLMAVINDLKERNKLPNSTQRRKLCLQVDNCGVNKNQTVIAFIALLVALDMFTEAQIDFLLVGHTHVLIDQWFRVLSQQIFTTSTRVWTTPLLQEFLRTKFNCTVFNFDAFTDFYTLMSTMKSQITGHSTPYSFRFFRREGRLSAEYQSSQNAGGVWYEMAVPLAHIPETNVIQVSAMPLKPYVISIPGAVFNEDGAWQMDDVTKLFATLRTKIQGINVSNQAIGSSMIDISWLDWWDTQLQLMRDADELERRVTDPAPPFKSEITLSIVNIGAPAVGGEQGMGVRPMTRAEYIAENMLPPEAGPTVTVRNTTDDMESASQVHEDLATRIQAFASKIRDRQIVFDDAPKLHEIVAWKWSNNEDGVETSGFAIGRVITNARYSEESGWTMILQSYMPRGWKRTRDLAVDPHKFATAAFAPELTRQVTTARRGRRSRTTTRDTQHEETLSISNIVMCEGMAGFQMKFRGNSVTRGGKIMATSGNQDAATVLEFACKHWQCATSVENAQQCRVCARAIARNAEAA
jgi:hypothetical protein